MLPPLASRPREACNPRRWLEASGGAGLAAQQPVTWPRGALDGTRMPDFVTTGVSRYHVVPCRAARTHVAALGPCTTVASPRRVGPVSQPEAAAKRVLVAE